MQLPETHLKDAMADFCLIWNLLQSSSAVKAPLFSRSACCSWARQSWRCFFILSCTVYDWVHTQTAYCLKYRSSQAGLQSLDQRGLCHNGGGHRELSSRKLLCSLGAIESPASCLSPSCHLLSTRASTVFLSRSKNNQKLHCRGLTIPGRLNAIGRVKNAGGCAGNVQPERLPSGMLYCARCAGIASGGRPCLGDSQRSGATATLPNAPAMPASRHSSYNTLLASRSLLALI